MSNYDWIITIIRDLQVFADANDMNCLAFRLEDAITTTLLEIEKKNAIGAFRAESTGNPIFSAPIDFTPNGGGNPPRM